MPPHDGIDAAPRVESTPAVPAVRHDRPGLRDKLDLRVVNADDPFQGDREICVLFDGVRYRLRITRRNRLILQK